MTCFRFFEKAVNQLFACDKNLREKVFRASSSRTFLTANTFGMSKFLKISTGIVMKKVTPIRLHTC